MIPEEKLKQVAKKQFKYDNSNQQAYILGAISEASREYWKSDFMNFLKWATINKWNYNYRHDKWLNGNDSIKTEQLYQEFIKQRQDGNTK